MKVITVGRAVDNDVVFDDPMLSRYHLQIVQDDEGRYLLVDLGSRNGTFKNGQRVKEETPLEDGDFVRAGNELLPWQDYFTEGFVPAPKRPDIPQQQFPDVKTITQSPETSIQFHPFLIVWLWISMGFYALFALIALIRVFSNYTGAFGIGMMLVGIAAVVGLWLVKNQKILGFYIFSGAHLMFFFIGCAVQPVRFFFAAILGVGIIAAMLAIAKDGKSGWSVLVNNNKNK